NNRCQRGPGARVAPDGWSRARAGARTHAPERTHARAWARANPPMSTPCPSYLGTGSLLRRTGRSSSCPRSGSSCLRSSCLRGDLRCQHALVARSDEDAVWSECPDRAQCFAPKCDELELPPPLARAAFGPQQEAGRVRAEDELLPLGLEPRTSCCRSSCRSEGSSCLVRRFVSLLTLSGAADCRLTVPLRPGSVVERVLSPQR